MLDIPLNYIIIVSEIIKGKELTNLFLHPDGF